MGNSSCKSTTINMRCTTIIKVDNTVFSKNYGTYIKDIDKHCFFMNVDNNNQLKLGLNDSYNNGNRYHLDYSWNKLDDVLTSSDVLTSDAISMPVFHKNIAIISIPNDALISYNIDTYSSSQIYIHKVINMEDFIEDFFEESEKEQICKNIVNYVGDRVLDIPLRFQTEEMWNIAVTKSANKISIKKLPLEYQSEELWVDMVNGFNNNISINDVPEQFQTLNLWAIYINKDPSLMKIVPSKYKTPIFYRKLIQLNPKNVKYIDDILDDFDELLDLAAKYSKVYNT